MNDVLSLIARSQDGDRNARDRLLEENTGLIWSVAKRFVGRGTELEDLFQLGCIGFLKAIDGFDLDYGTQFSTYAVPKIAGEIRRFIRDDGAIKVSRGIKERANLIKQVSSQLTTQLGRDPTVTEIAEKTGLTVEQIAAAEVATAQVESIQKECGEDGFSLANILTDAKGEEQFLEQIALRQAVSSLPEREAIVIKLRYFHGLTQDRIAKVMGVSQVQVSRIEKKAILFLRECLK